MQIEFLFWYQPERGASGSGCSQGVHRFGMHDGLVAAHVCGIHDGLAQSLPSLLGEWTVGRQARSRQFMSWGTDVTVDDEPTERHLLALQNVEEKRASLRALGAGVVTSMNFVLGSAKSSVTRCARK